MKSSTKILLGILTFAPFVLILIYIFYLFLAFIPTAIRAGEANEEVPTALFGSISVMILLIVLMIVIRLSVTIYYIVHASNNPKNESGTKIMWIVLLILVGTITSIVYYFVEILPSKEPAKSIGYN
ncbi:MAG: PLDc N-terminal domain-containing protein [Flavobacteriaceae bacterium]|nr:PLDc N-terminal domain-containing protein [Flavobacteriaceae bacterium]